MRHLSIDIETYSSVDISSAGAYKYAESEDFEILLFAYKWGDFPTEVIDLAQGEELPQHIIDALQDPDVVKHAYNAAFEWYCLNQAGYTTPIEQWSCTMIHGLCCGYPAGLAATGTALHLSEDKQKLTTGKALIKYFCNPCKPTRTNGQRTRNLPKDDPAKWQLFKEYNAQDVEAEYEIQKRLSPWPIPETVQEEWVEDIKLNARGVKVDVDLIASALQFDAENSSNLLNRASELTGLQNPNSRAQLLQWINRHGVIVDNIRKETVEDLLETDLPDNVREVLELRQQLGKTSVSKYEAMENARCADDRVKGMLQFYGTRTGRWAGRLVQVQNLPRNYLKTLDLARTLVKERNFDGIRLVYGNVQDTLSQLIRTAFIPEEGKKFIVSDFSAIEARVIAWLAGENWVLDVFKNGGDIYCATASNMFGVPVEKHGQNSELRQKGKIATLALGYQGGTGALISMGALKQGIPEEELPDIVTKWREANPNIVSFWNRVDKLSKYTLNTGEPTYISGLTFRLESNPANYDSFLTIELPSGRKVFYPAPYMGKNRFGQEAIHYFGLNQTTKKWEDLETFGGKLTENIVQAVARDCLAVTLTRVIERGYTPVMHIHDEIVIEADPDMHLDDVNAIFAEPIPWAPGLPLKGAGFESNYYMKD